MPRLAKSAHYTVAAGDSGKVIRADASGGTITLKLPASGASDGDFVVLRKQDAGANRVTVQDNNGTTDIAWLSGQRAQVMLVWWNGAWIVSHQYISPLRQI